MKTTSTVLELINGSLAILAGQLVVICVLYCIHQSRRLHMRWREWFVALPIGMALALAIALRDTGDFGRYATVWLWRILGAGEMSHLQQTIAGGSSIIAGLGALAMIYVLTREWFGFRMLALCAGFVAAFLAGSLILR